MEEKDTLKTKKKCQEAGTFCWNARRPVGTTRKGLKLQQVARPKLHENVRSPRLAASTATNNVACHIPSSIHPDIPSDQEIYLGEYWQKRLETTEPIR